MRWLDGIIDSMDMNLGKFWEMLRDRKPGMLQSMRSQRVRYNLATKQQQGYFYVQIFEEPSQFSTE